MSPILVGFIAVLLVPLFASSWRLSLLGLALQGLLMAWISYHRAPDLGALETWAGLLDLLVVRGLAAPLLLYRVLRVGGAPARNDVLPPNLLWWALAVGGVLLAFRLAEQLVPIDGDERAFVAVATAGLLLGMLVLGTQTGPFSQMIGALRIENAIALFELGAPADHLGLGVRLAQTALLLGTVGLFRWYLAALRRAPAQETA